MPTVIIRENGMRITVQLTEQQRTELNNLLSMEPEATQERINQLIDQVIRVKSINKVKADEFPIIDLVNKDNRSQSQVFYSTIQYVNPFDLLGITTENLSDVNSYSINKSKRKLITEVELSNSKTSTYDCIELNTGDCIKIIDELDNKDYKEFHFFTYGNLPLKKFLTTCDIRFFENFQTESIYNLPEFLEFISPFFTQQYDRTLLDNYKQANRNTLVKLLANKPIVNSLYYEKCFKSTYSYIKEIDNEIKIIINEISNGKSPFINKQFVGLDLLIVEKVNVDLLNILPSYFQSLKNQLAMSIRNLARDINNKPFEYFEPAFRIIEVAYNISIDALTKQTISKGYFVIKKNYEDEVSKHEATKREDENRRIITKWTEIENQIE